MRKILRKPGFNIAQSGVVSSLTMVNHQLVLPNETITKHQIRARFRSNPIRHPLMGAYLDTFTFLVPLSILWAGWEDFIAEGTGAPPTQATDFPSMLLRAGDPQFPYLAQRHIYENFFKSPYIENDSATLLPAVNTSAETSIFSPDLFPEPESVRMDVENDGTDYVELKIEDLWEAEYRERMRSKLGTKFQRPYLDLLSAYGVRATEYIPHAEYLGGTRQYMYPSPKINEETGFTVQSFMADISYVRDRKRTYVAEHSVLVDFVALRPKFYYAGRGISTEGLRTEREHYHLPVKSPDHLFRVDAGALFDGGSVPGEMDLRSPLFRGEQRVGDVLQNGPEGQAPYVASLDPADAAEVNYPYRAVIAANDLAAGKQWVCEGRVSSHINTWLRPPVQPSLTGALDD